MNPTFFRTPAAFRRWLEAHHARKPELWVGLYHRASGKGGITYPQALEQALCFGWIDGVRRNHDATSYKIRFTPRKQGSNWSLVNLRLAKRLVKEGRMRKAGLASYAARTRSPNYGYEPPEALAPRYLKQIKANARAMAFFQAQPPGFQRSAAAWIMTAKQEETRQRRLAELIAAAERGRRPGAFLVTRQERAADAAREGAP